VSDAGPGGAIERLHATTVALHGSRGWRGVLLTGASGAGKSDLALRLIGQGARLVADDVTLVWSQGQGLHATAPATIAGRMEVRGLGIVPQPTRDVVRLALAVVCAPVPPERLPEAERLGVGGLDLPLLRLDARSPSAATVVMTALRTL
jgi:serine kinase of HPr protein (carbohydrate metabolism regulator)